MDMDTIKERNREAGKYFFEPDTMRFLGSRIPQNTVDGSSYFVTSEQREWNEPRLFTIRVARPDGSIGTVGEFQQYGSRAQAVAAVRRILKDEHVTA